METAIVGVHAALDCGINYFDVAPAYGGTRSETVLGKALRGVARSRYHLSTKVGKYTNPAAYGDEKWWRVCYAYWMCGSPNGTELGSENFRKPDIEKV